MDNLPKIQLNDEQLREYEQNVHLINALNFLDRLNAPNHETLIQVQRKKIEYDLKCLYDDIYLAIEELKEIEQNEEE